MKLGLKQVLITMQESKNRIYHEVCRRVSGKSCALTLVFRHTYLTLKLYYSQGQGRVSDEYKLLKQSWPSFSLISCIYGIYSNNRSSLINAPYTFYVAKSHTNWSHGMLVECAGTDESDVLY